ncbi:uncharacterized protein H6S33_008652 [Morchella sextelata]|jgi:hypothetical protein|uniref:uncharacterized protein n=1 Tax=Morchella sextelata TaxID=1174677 RepID=UPI001D05BE10|nr:uncharacterized protein H6S33_008652 [Morchella sextelata]KAH0602571.1 hypothetical protein H6S33_008652 [Morchella sextelata]
MRSTPLEDIDPTLRGDTIDLQQDVALQRSLGLSDTSAQFKQPPNDTVLPTSTPTRKRRRYSKMNIQKPPIELRERYPSGRLKEFRPRFAYGPVRLAEIRKDERTRAARYRDGLRALAVAAGHCDTSGQAAFIVELKRLRKVKREAEREARNTKTALTTGKGDSLKGKVVAEPQMVVEGEEILQVQGAGSGGCEVQDTVHAEDKMVEDSRGLRS